MGLCIESAKQHNKLVRERNEKLGGMKKKHIRYAFCNSSIRAFNNSRDTPVERQEIETTIHFIYAKQNRSKIVIG